MAKSVYGIEGLDRLGKSTLIEGIRNKLGYYEVIHFSKPQTLDVYNHSQDHVPAYLYQQESFRNSMLLARSGARIIFDRWHLGEAVYSNIYRGYNGDYVFGIETMFAMDECFNTRLILLVEDFDRSLHFKSDGDSFDDSKRMEEQALFINAFNKSIIPDKKMICVTAKNGNFRPREDILAEALS